MTYLFLTGKYGFEINCAVDNATGFRFAAEVHHSHLLGGTSGICIVLRLLADCGILDEEDVTDERTGKQKKVYTNRHGLRYRITFDRKFTSVRLLRILWQLGIEAVGTYRPNRQDWPKELSEAVMMVSNRKF